MAAPQPQPRRTFPSLNAPKPIFLGWTGMVLLAGCGYAYAKSLNTAKKKEMMRRGLSDEEQERLRLRDESGLSGGAGPHGQQLSPLQSLIRQFQRAHGDK